MISSIFDIIYISYDEPNASENYQDLKSKITTAKHLHGVKGFDNSIKEASKLASTDSFFIIDGDNKVTLDFLDLREIGQAGKNQVMSWASKNIINGLIYGNGGIKLWNKKLASQIDGCHKGKGTDWCHKFKYLQQNSWYSYSFCNASPYQAFRAGLREGVKLCLDSNGMKLLNLEKSIEIIPQENLKRLVSWMTLGRDVVNGEYSLFGARYALLRVMLENKKDFSFISNFVLIKELWDQELSFVKNGNYQEELVLLGKKIEERTGLPVFELNSEQSKLSKYLQYNPRRRSDWSAYETEIDKGYLNKEY